MNILREIILISLVIADHEYDFSLIGRDNAS